MREKWIVEPRAANVWDLNHAAGEIGFKKVCLLKLLG